MSGRPVVEPSLLSQLTLPEVERREEINAELDHQGRADSVEYAPTSCWPTSPYLEREDVLAALEYAAPLRRSASWQW